MSKRERRRNVIPPRIVPLSPSDDAIGRHRQQREHEPRRYQGGWDIFLFLASLFVLMIGLLVVCNLLLASVPIDSPRVQPTVTALDFEAVVVVLAVMVGAAFVGYSAIRRIRTTTARAASHNNAADSMQHDKDDAKYAMSKKRRIQNHRNKQNAYNAAEVGVTLSGAVLFIAIIVALLDRFPEIRPFFAATVLTAILIAVINRMVQISSNARTDQKERAHLQPVTSIASKQCKQEIKARQRRDAEIANNADQAVVRARNEMGNTPLLLDDIGVIAYHDSVHPSIIRTGAVVTDSTHLQPFVVLTPRLAQEAGRVTVSFNLIDEQGNVCYTSRAGYTLQDGQNFVTPNTWLQLAGTPIGSGTWSLHVSLDDQPPLAIHEFGWREPVQLQFGSDGEIDKHTKKLMKQHLALADDEPLSLDDLLAEQHGSATAKNQ